jgi:dephospho-CoA kinase
MKKYIVYVGVVGQIACGKGALVDFLTKKLDFVSFSLSSILHDELKKRSIKVFTRKTLQDIGDQLRNRYGDDVLAKRAIELLKKQGEKHVVIEGIRNPGEIEYLKKNPAFVLIGVKANRELRFKRLLSRSKPWDPKNWNDFVKVDRRDLGVGQQKSGQQVGKCLAYCDYTLTNNKDLIDFQRKVKELMKKVFILNGNKV